MFLREVPGSAQPGQIKDVAPGYARNYLLPKKLAVPAGTRIVEQSQQREEAARRRVEKVLAESQEIAQRLRRITVTLHAKTGEGGRLFGSITNADIAKQLKHDAGIDIDKRHIEVEPAIKTLGPHEVNVHVHTEVDATLRIVVAAQ